MVKRFFALVLVLFLLIGALPPALSQSECQQSDSSYARAVQLHDMGDYDRALRYYECARQEDPDNAIIPLLIENVHEDIANAGKAWSRPSETASASICSPYVNHGWRGETAFDRGDFIHALIHLQCVLRRDPADESALNRLGEIYINRGDTRTAQHYFNRAEAARASEGASATAAIDAEAQADPAQPAKFEMPDWLTPYETVPGTRHSSPPQPIVVFTEHSRLLVQTEQTLVIADDHAVTTWQRLQRLYVERIKIIIRTGEMTLTLYKQRALAMSREAMLTLSAPDAAINLREKARKAFRDGDLEGATDLMKQVAERPDATAADFDYLASLHSMGGDMEAAEGSLKSALELAPSDLDLRCRLGMAHAAQGETEAAYAQFDWVLSLDIANICASENKRALTRSFNIAAAATVAEAAVSPARPTFQRALELLEKRRLYAAANTLIEALSQDPDHLAARCHLGAIFTEWAHYGGALAQFDRILSQDPQNTCAREERKIATLAMLAMYVPLTVDDFFYHARTFVRVEEWELARDAFRKGLELDPSRADVRCELGMLYSQLGDERAALGEFDRVLAQHISDSCAWSNREALMQRQRSK